MNGKQPAFQPRSVEDASIGQRIFRAYKEFLWIPTVVVLGFILLAYFVFLIERSPPDWLDAARRILAVYLFSSGTGTHEFLITLAGAMLTVTSITISMLLVVLQQSVSVFSGQVVDQFLNQRRNQVYLGFFVGASMFNLLILAAVPDEGNPIIGAFLTLLFTGLVLYTLILMLYETIVQMRPEVILNSIHDNTLKARRRHFQFVRRTRPEPVFSGPVRQEVRSQGHGFLTGIKLKPLEEAFAQVQGEVEIQMIAVHGTYVAYQDILATIHAAKQEDVQVLETALRQAVKLETERESIEDPYFGIEQLSMVAWTVVSTAKSDPQPGLVAVHSLRDILAHWAEDVLSDQRDDDLPIVYRDYYFEQTMDALESLALVTVDSLQHQVLAEILRTVTLLYERFPEDGRPRMDSLIYHLLPMLRGHYFTTQIETAVSGLVAALESASNADAAWAVKTTLQQMRRTIHEAILEPPGNEEGGVDDRRETRSEEAGYPGERPAD